MQVYNVDIKRLALLLLPTILRKPVLFTIVKSACKSLESLQGQLFSYQNNCNVRISHTPQVCYLKGILDDTFCKGTNKHFEIEDTQSISGEWLMTYEEGETHADIIPLVAIDEQTIIYTEDAIHEIAQDFIVEYPSGVNIEPDNDNYKIMVAICNQYRLASKTPLYQKQD